jgi:hypothetical protein
LFRKNCEAEKFCCACGKPQAKNLRYSHAEEAIRAAQTQCGDAQTKEERRNGKGRKESGMETSAPFIDADHFKLRGKFANCIAPVTRMRYWQTGDEMQSRTRNLCGGCRSIANPTVL